MPDRILNGGQGGIEMEFMVMVILVIIGIIAVVINDKMKITPNEEQKIIGQWGSISTAYICPHCQTKGFVHTKPVKRKKGVSGAKATGALLTLGFSMLATGLSRKETMTQAHCENCNSTWDF